MSCSNEFNTFKDSFKRPLSAMALKKLTTKSEYFCFVSIETTTSLLASRPTVGFSKNCCISRFLRMNDLTLIISDSTSLILLVLSAALNNAVA